MWWDEVRAKKNLEIGDTVAIKGMRSHLNGRKRMEGEIVDFSGSSVTVNCGVPLVGAHISSIILLKKGKKS